MYGATSGEVAISKIDGAINQAILAIFLDENIDKYFIYQYLTKNKAGILHKYLQGGQGNLSANIIKNINIKIPTDYEEAKKVGSLLKGLDKLITLHSEKLNVLEKLKEKFLRNLFI